MSDDGTPLGLERPRNRALAFALSMLIPGLGHLYVGLPWLAVRAFLLVGVGVPLFALGVFLVLWRGVGAKPLALAGGAVLGIALPLLYIAIPPENRGDFNPEYSIDRIVAHWVAVAGVTLLILALSRAMGRPGRARSAPPSAAAPPAPRP